MLASFPPLRSTSRFLEEPSTSSAVAVRTSEPFWSGQASSLQLLLRAVQLQMLLEREGSAAAPRPLEEICASRPRVAQLLEQLFADATVLSEPGATSPVPLLEATGLSTMCPLVAHYLGDPDRVYRSDDVPAVREYLEYLGALNQLLCIATQLRDDVRAGRHKYAAHKIALLYHAINNSKLARDVLRKRIEEHFEDVKEATETQEAPVLPPELAEWIVELCDQVAGLVREPPASFATKAAPAARYLQATMGVTGEDSRPASPRVVHRSGATCAE
jgi:hypothetical protein